MKIKDFNLAQQVMVIAEVGNNHEGDYVRAQELLDAAAESGAHAVKFQTIIPDLFVNRHVAPERYAKIQSFQLSFDQFASLKERADRKNIIFLSTPFDLDSAGFLDTLVPAFKIGSPENTFYPLLMRVSSFKKPIILSCGAADLPIISRAIDCIRRVSPDVDIALLHCVSAYPTPPEQANLLAISQLRAKFGLTVGYSDHTLGIDAAILSVALGARIIEKHFTLDKNFSSFRDHQLSADPTEMRTLVVEVEKASLLLGDGMKKVESAEEASLLAIRRSIVANRDLKLGEEITLEKITWTRPGGGLSPGEENILLGKHASRNILSGEMIKADDVK